MVTSFQPYLKSSSVKKKTTENMWKNQEKEGEKLKKEKMLKWVVFSKPQEFRKRVVVSVYYSICINLSILHTYLMNYPHCRAISGSPKCDNYNTGVINDPLGMTQSVACSEYCFRKSFCNSCNIAINIDCVKHLRLSPYFRRFAI